MRTETIRPVVSVSEPTLYVAFELGAKTWTLAMTAALGRAPWVCGVAAGALPRVVARLAEGRRRCGLGPTARVVSCYEAGRDGSGSIGRSRPRACGMWWWIRRASR